MLSSFFFLFFFVLALGFLALVSPFLRQVRPTFLDDLGNRACNTKAVTTRI